MILKTTGDHLLRCCFVQRARGGELATRGTLLLLATKNCTAWSGVSPMKFERVGVRHFREPALDVQWVVLQNGAGHGEGGGA